MRNNSQDGEAGKCRARGVVTRQNFDDFVRGNSLQRPVLNKESEFAKWRRTIDSHCADKPRYGQKRTAEVKMVELLPEFD